MPDLLFIPHYRLNQKQLSEIIEIKSKYWPYSRESQVQWMEKNIKGNDIHVMLMNDNIILAYLNLVNIVFKIDGSEQTGFGIGNVCVREKGQGSGKRIISQTNDFLLKESKIGLLFCKNSLVKFYSENQWSVIEKRLISLTFDNKLIETMSFNLQHNFKMFEYLGKSF